MFYVTVLPTRIVSSLCQGEIEVKFLKEFNSSCLRRIPKSKAECQQLDLIPHDRVVSSLTLLNMSLYEVYHFDLLIVLVHNN